MKVGNYQGRIPKSELAKINCGIWSRGYMKVKIGDEWKPFRLNRRPYFYPFLNDIYRSIGYGGAKHIVLMKGRKVAATTLALNAILYIIDTFSVNGIYALPNQHELHDFVKSRFDPLINNCPHIKAMFSDVSNQSLKVGRHGSLYFRGVRSEVSTEEVAAGAVILDELDYMDPEHAAQLLKCLGGSLHKFQIDLGHPITPSAGIHATYMGSSRGKWMFKCPHCGEEQELVPLNSSTAWMEGIDFKNKTFICRNCGKPLTKQDIWKGHWKHEEPSNPVRGWHISQLLSPTESLENQLHEWELAQGIPYKVKLFYNTVLGMPYAEGSKRLTPDDVRKLMVGPPMANYGDGGTIGIDVGEKALHYVIVEGDTVVRVGVVPEWEELDRIMESFTPKRVIIDAGPEGHQARQYMEKLREAGIDAWVCRRSAGLEGKRKVDSERHTITVNITESLDRMYGALKKLALPIDLPSDAIEQLCAPLRTTRKGPDGTVKGVYIKGISHYADALSYAVEGMSDFAGYHAPSLLVEVPMLKRQSKWTKFRSEV